MDGQHDEARVGALGRGSEVLGARLLEPIGRGGQGEVWAARGPGGQPCVVKLVPVDTSDPRALARRAREARVGARVVDAHPALIAPVDEGVAPDGRWAMRLPRVHGPSLAEFIARRGPLAPSQVARLAVELAAILGALHAVGVVHRDVTPSNVLLDGGWDRDDLCGRAFLCDLGCAVMPATGHTARTATGEIVGTPGCLAPEQVTGAPPGPATDAYGLGATLYAAMAGAGPFAGRVAVEQIQAAVEEAPAEPAPPPDAAAWSDDEITAWRALRGVVIALLAKPPGARLTLEEVAARLTPWAPPRPARRAPGGRVEPAQARPPRPAAEGHEHRGRARADPAARVWLYAAATAVVAALVWARVLAAW